MTLDDLTAHVAAHAASDDGLDRLDAVIAVAARRVHQADALVDHLVTVVMTPDGLGVAQPVGPSTRLSGSVRRSGQV